MMFAMIQQEVRIFSQGMEACLTFPQFQFLVARTQLRIITIAVRPSLDAYNAPFVFCSDPRVSLYFETLTKKTVQELAIGLEGFCISGVTCTSSLRL